MKTHFLLPALLILSACATPGPGTLYDIDAYLGTRGVPPPAPESFGHCHAYGCKMVTPVSLTDQDWREIDALFSPPPASAEEERARLPETIALFERKVGAITGTEEDINDTFNKIGTYQHDCVDESTNTTIYLRLLEQRGHLNFHDIRRPQTRFPVFAGSFWPHLTAVIVDRQTRAEYALDSWFEDNGKPAYVVPLDEWSAGWHPPEDE